MEQLTEALDLSHHGCSHERVGVVLHHVPALDDLRVKPLAVALWYKMVVRVLDDVVGLNERVAWVTTWKTGG